MLRNLNLYVLCAPHLDSGGQGNSGFVVEVAARWLLVAEKADHWMALGSSCPFSPLSCGYVGKSDGYTDLVQNGRMKYEFDQAKEGNIALTGELALSGYHEFTVGIAFGEDLSSAVSSLFQSLGISYEEQEERFRNQWKVVTEERQSLKSVGGDQGRLFRASYNVIACHEDKTYRGAFIASLAIPWGEAKNDSSGVAGYHLVWTRDLVQSAMALMAAGNADRALRALIYLAVRQEEDGSFAQNFWVNGTPFRKALQLDEVAFPVLLARRLHHLDKLGDFNPRIMVKRAMKMPARSHRLYVGQPSPARMGTRKRLAFLKVWRLPPISFRELDRYETR